MKKTPFYLVFQVLKVLLIKNYNLQLPVPLSLVVLLQLLYQQMYFYNILEVRSTLFEKKVFVMNFPFYQIHSNLPHTFNGQNPLKALRKFFVDAPEVILIKFIHVRYKINMMGTVPTL